jgi:hypothetical protein
VTKEPTGFETRNESTISFSDSSPDRTFTIAPVASSFTFYVKGEKFTKTAAEDLQLPNSSGNHYIYYNASGVLESTQVSSADLFTSNALVAIVYFNTETDTHSYFGEERHGLQMDGATHSYLHTVFGSQYLSGLALQNFVVDGNGSLATHAQFTGDQGSIRDEDLLLQIAAQTQIPVLYRIGTLWRKKAADSFPMIYSGTAGYVGASGRIPYNQLVSGSYELTQVSNTGFVLVHVFATNDIETPIIAIQGTNQYGNVSAARAAASTEITSLTGIPFAEFVALGSVVLESSNSYVNTPKAVVRSVNGGNYVDFRGTQLYTPAGVASSHSLLSNLSSDDHLQYHTDARGDARYYTKSEIDTTVSGKANTNLSNLVTTSIPSGVDIISNSGAGVQFDVKTANSSTGNTGIASFGSGSSTAGSSSYAELITGTGTTGTGAAYVETGKSTTGLSGAILLVTGVISSGGLINNISNTSGTGSVTIASGFSSNTSSTVPTGVVQIFSGGSSSSVGSGAVTMNSGQTTNVAGTTGNVTVRSGESTQINATAGTGITLVRSGNVTGTNSTGASGSVLVRSGTTINGNSGQAELTSGAVSGTGQSGTIVVRSGTTNSGNSGQVEFSSGSSTSGNSGATVITTGTAGGTRGNIYLLSPVIFTNDTSTETVVTTKNEIVAANLIDLLNMTGSVYHKNLTENVGFTFSIPSNSGKKFTIVTKNATGSSYTVNFPTVKQKAGTINNTVAANTTSIFEFLISDNEIYCISCIDNIV